MNGCGKTDVGRTRLVNQDSFVGMPLEGGYLAVVCDGMGGAAGGGIASSIAKDIFTTEFTKAFQNYCSSGYEDGAPATIIPRLMREAMKTCNKFTNDLSNGDPGLKGMGTTLVCALVYCKKLYVCNVGDSRAYTCFDGKVCQITKDHSYVQELIDKGRMTEEEARKNEQKNIITRAVGVEKKVKADTFVIDLTSDNGYILLCTDGLSNYLSSDDIATILTQPDEMMGFERKVQVLVDLANRRGGTDNITAYLIDPA